ncbi:viral A-type inclusion protein [Histomonas meleagridis]|uniref:viral A-type inclusion protein n=1 Tax=Histomonas meleagridis TaxID=135588 RepID=UPI00355A61CF|nr:viral A-type inclusion protein [Histomonas meleagridis]KAH0804168.1 viral A-type inclusion protein [Histomonas meleagridis]
MNKKKIKEIEMMNAEESDSYDDLSSFLNQGKSSKDAIPNEFSIDNLLRQREIDNSTNLSSSLSEGNDMESEDIPDTDSSYVNLSSLQQPREILSIDASIYEKFAGNAIPVSQILNFAGFKKEDFQLPSLKQLLEFQFSTIETQPLLVESTPMLYFRYLYTLIQNQTYDFNPESIINITHEQAEHSISYTVWKQFLLHTISIDSDLMYPLFSTFDFNIFDYSVYEQKGESLHDILIIYISFLFSNKVIHHKLFPLVFKTIKKLFTDPQALEVVDENIISSVSNYVLELFKQLPPETHQITTLKTTINALDNQNKSLQNDFNNLQNSLNSMHEIMESQLNDVQSLSHQRSQLIEITKKQDLMIEKYEALYKESMKNHDKITTNKTNTELQKQFDVTDELYSLMSAIIHEIDGVKDASVQTEIAKITNDSNLPIKERIISIFTFFKSKLESLYEMNKNILNEMDIKDKNLQECQQKCKEVLSLFEEELSFLQKLTHSSDLQSVIFCTPNSNEVPLLDEQSKSELIKRCAQLGRFIEETIGRVSNEKFEEQFPIDGIDTSHIFDLLQSTQMEDRVQNMVEKFDIENNVDLRELFDMFCAQVYINELLKNYTTELNLRIAHCGNEINILRQKKENNDDQQIPNKSISKLIKHMKHVDSKIRRFVGHYIEISDDESTYKIVVDLFNVMTGEIQKSSSSFQETEQMQNEIKRLRKALGKSKRKTNDSESTSEIESQLSSIQYQLNETSKELEVKSKEFENLQKQIEQKNEEIANYKSQIEEDEKKHKEYQERLNSSTTQINTLNKQINNFETVFERVKKQRKQLGDQIERLQHANQQLNKSIQKANQQTREEYENKINQIMEKMEKIQNENENYTQQNQVLNAKNQQLLSELSTLRISNKSIELKMRTLEERINLEKKLLQSRATAQATVIQVEQSQQINDLKSKLGEISDRLSKYLDNKYTFNIDSIINAAEEELKNSKASKEHYMEMLEDVTNVKSQLGISSATKISDYVQEILSTKENKQKEVGENLKKLQQEHKEYEQMKREMKKAESQIIALKQWENWGRRIHRVIHETDSIHLESDALRLSLEEALLASVSHRVFFFRTELLRAQKLLLIKFDKRLLMCKQPPQYNIRAVIAVCLFTRRLQTMAGCLPINIPPPDPIIRPNQISRSDKETPKRNLLTPGKYSQLTTKKLLHPLIPYKV